MGFWDRLRGRKSVETSTSITTTHIDTDLGSGQNTVVRDGVVVTDPAQQQAIVDEIDHLAHEFLAAGGVMAGAGGANVTSTTTVMVDGQRVGPDDPRAQEKMREAIAKLRAQGLDEIADELERQMGAAGAPTRTAATPAGVAGAVQAEAAFAGRDAGGGATAAPADMSSTPPSETAEASTGSSGEAPAGPVEAPDAPEAPSPPSV